MNRREANHDDADPGLDAKLLGALDRAGHALEAELRRRARAERLTLTQARILLRLASWPSGRRRVGALAAEFDLRQPTVSDAVAALERKGLVRRRRGGADARVVELEPTAAGRKAAARLGDWDERVTAALAALGPGRKADILVALLATLGDLHRQGVIAEARMCTTCRFFGRREGSPFCELLEIPLGPADLRVDCPEHEPREAATP